MAGGRVKDYVYGVLTDLSNYHASGFCRAKLLKGRTLAVDAGRHFDFFIRSPTLLGSSPIVYHSAPLRGPEKLSFLTKKIYLLRPGGQGAAMKQAIAGIAGLKPRASKPEGDGKLSKQESHALDAEYRRQRNLAASIEKSEGANALGEGPRRIG